MRRAPLPLNPGILTLARTIGETLDCQPIEQMPVIAEPTRCSRGRWPADVWAEMQAIYETPDPFAREANRQAEKER